MKTTKTNRNAVRQPQWLWRAALAGLTLAASVGVSLAQNVIVDKFDNATGAAESAAWVNNPGWGVTAASPTWTADDAQSSASSGSAEFQWTYTSGGAPGVEWQTSAPPGTDLSRATFIEFDLMVDPASGVDNNGNICAFQGGPGGVKIINFNLGAWGTPFTKGVWQHFKIAIPPGTYTSPVSTFYLNPWGGSGWGAITTPQTMIIHLDNLVIDVPAPTYPDYQPQTFLFDDTNTVVTVGTTGWYGHAVTVEWATNQSTIANPDSNPNSGSLHLVAAFAGGDNNCVVAIPMDTNYPGFSSPTPDTNVVINGMQFATVEMDVLWDTNLSTVSITNFNSVGDVNGFPLGLLVNTTGAGGQEEAFGTGTTAVPDEASNGWVHLSFPVLRNTAGIDQTIGLWLKKYSGNTNAAFTGTVAFYIDNVKFIGGSLISASPLLSISKPVKGLQTVASGAGGAYDREDVVTFDGSYTFVNQVQPVTYAMNIAYCPPGTFGGYLVRIMLVPLQAPSVDGTDASPDWNYPNILIFEITRSSTNSRVVLREKINEPASNGDLYPGNNDASLPAFTTPSPIEGNWLFTVTQNTNILVTAPDGSSTNLTFPNNYDSSAVSANFDYGLGMVAYFGSDNNGSGNIGQRVVLAHVGITNGSTTLISDNFATDNSLALGTGGWLVEAGGGASSTYVLPQSTKWFLDWTVPGSGFFVQTNVNLATGSWGTNAITSTLLGTHYHAEVDQTNLPAGGTVFFRINNAPTQ